MSRASRGPEARLTAILGSERVLAGDAAEAWGVGGMAPAAVAFPRELAEVREILVEATAQGWAVVPAGQGLSLAAGEPCTRVDVVLSTSRMDRTVHYEPADLTLSVEAGATLEAVTSLTAEEGQWLPMEPPGSPASTLGGVVGWGIGDALATSFGRPRDLVMGLTCVTGDGRILHLGGRVVKNVAGFDVLKLLVGSQGTLGVITEVTVRLFPSPQCQGLLVARTDEPGDLVPLARAVATAPVLPASVEVTGPLAGEGGGPCALFVRIQGSPEAVAADGRVLQEAAPGLALDESTEVETDRARLRTLEEVAPLSGRLAVPPVRLGQALVLLSRSMEGLAGRGDHGPTFVADPVTGVVRFGAHVEADEGDALAERLLEARREVEDFRGSLTLVQAPPGVMSRVGARGAPTPAVRRIQRGLKASFDPAGTLSPGRLGS